MTAVLADVLLLDGLLRSWADKDGLGAATAHQAFEDAVRALVGGASLSEAVRVGRRLLELELEHRDEAPGSLQPEEVLA